MKKNVSVVGVSVLSLIAASAAMGQGPRVDYRVLAEFGPSAGGDWPLVVQNFGVQPTGLMQFADGGLLWDSDKNYWIDDSGVVEVLGRTTRIPGLPDVDLDFSVLHPSRSIGERSNRLDDGRSIFVVSYQSAAGGIPLTQAMILGSPRDPERAMLGNAFVPVSRDALVADTDFNGARVLVGEFGGAMSAIVQRGMAVGGRAPGGTLFDRFGNTVEAMFGADGSVRFVGVPQGGIQSFPAIYRNGVLEATLFGTMSIPGVSVEVSAPRSSQDVVLEDGRILMSGRTNASAWIVNPDGTGRDIVTPSTVIPGYPPEYRVWSTGELVSTADGRIYLHQSYFTDGVSTNVRRPGLFEHEGDGLRLIVAEGDPRLTSPSGTVASVDGASAGANFWISSGGRIVWIPAGGNDVQSIIFADRTGVVIPALWRSEAGPGPLAPFGRVELFGASDTISRDFGRIGSDLPSSTTRLAADGSLAFWIRMIDGSNRRRTFAVAARLNVCPPDINEDGFVDFFDYGAFVDCFESGQDCGRFNFVDFNQDGFTDFFDYAAFVEAFEVGC